ncbi:MAG TPA: BBP7 family outer membrane beta-barrel protein [Pirellulaceae bacterium]|nr:BBP7 family outer membrane beta-barrel protein [Pirellulaceae bacterium]
MQTRFWILNCLVAIGAIAGATTAHAQHYVGFRPGYDQPGYGPAQGVAYAADQDPNQLDMTGEEGLAPAVNTDTSCTDGAACGCEECCRWWPDLRPAPGWFANVEYNLWWNKTRTVPPLVTTSPVGTSQALTGVLPGAQTLFGNDKVGDGLGSGGRLTFGRWLDEYETFALAGKFWAFRGKDGEFNQTADGTNLAIPFFDAQLGIENAYQVAFAPAPGVVFANGSISVQDRLDMLGAEAYAQFLVYDEQFTRVDLLGGYHTVRLDNSLQETSLLNVVNGGFIGSPPGSSIFIQDTFEGRNQFHGGELGLNVTHYYDRWAFHMLGKMSVGNMHQTIIIDGNTVVTTPGPTVSVRDEGLFALGTNQGTYSRDRIAYIPEVNAKVTYWVHPNVNLSLGYTFMYINSVVLAGDQIDRQLNLSQTNGGTPVGPNQNRPMFQGFRETDYWVQGINFGVECKF